MKQRLIFLIRLFIGFLVIFIIQKPIFMLMNFEFAKETSLTEWIEVMVNGIKLDLVTSSYLMVLPLFFTIASIWIKSLRKVRDVCKYYYVIIVIIVIAAFVVDASLYGFWKFKLDSTIFAYLDSPKGAMASISIWFIIGRFLLFILLCLASFLFLYRLTPKEFSEERTKKNRSIQTIILALLIAPLFICIRGGVEESTANVGMVYFSPKEFLNHSAVNPLFSFLYSLGKNEDFGSQFNYYDDKQLAALTNGLYSPTDSVNISLLNSQKPNVLLIVMEGFGQMFLESGGASANIAPNLNRLSHEGVYFNNCYSNSFRTDRGLVSTLSGYPAFPTLSVMKISAKSQKLPTIAHELKRHGYITSLLYGGDINFTGMQGYFRAGGYDEIVSDKDFPASQKQNAWGVNDDVTFSWLYTHLMEMPKNKTWHQMFLTLSSHEPFDVPYTRLKDKKANAWAYTDHCLGTFIEKIRKTSLWKNLLIVCIPDHGFPYPEDISHINLQHNEMLWLGGAVKRPMVVNTLMNQSDFAATFLAQLGLSHKAFQFSRNIFSPAYKQPFIFSCSRGTVIYRDSTGYIDYDVNANRINDAQGKNKDFMLKRLKAILQSNYDALGKL